MARPQEARLDTLQGVVRNASPGVQQDAPRELLGFDLDRAGGYVAAWRRREGTHLLLPTSVLHHDELGNALLAGRRVLLQERVWGPVDSLQKQALSLLPGVGVLGAAEPQAEDRYVLGVFLHDVFGECTACERLSGVDVAPSGTGDAVAAGAYRFMVLLQAPTSVGFATYQVLTRDYNNGSGTTALVLTLPDPLPVGYAARAFWWNTASAEPSFEEIGTRQISDGSNLRFRLTRSEILDPTSVALLRFEGLLESHRNRVWGQATEQAFAGPYVAGFSTTPHFQVDVTPGDDSAFTLASTQNDEIDAHFETDRTWRVSVQWDRGITVALTNASFTPRVETFTDIGSVAYRALGSDREGTVYALEGTDTIDGSFRQRDPDGAGVASFTGLSAPAHMSVYNRQVMLTTDSTLYRWDPTGTTPQWSYLRPAFHFWRSVTTFRGAFGGAMSAVGSDNARIDIMRSNGTRAYTLDGDDLPEGPVAHLTMNTVTGARLVAVTQRSDTAFFSGWLMQSNGAPLLGPWRTEELATIESVASSHVTEFVYYATGARLGRIDASDGTRTTVWRNGPYKRVWTDVAGRVYAYRKDGETHTLECLTEDGNLVWDLEVDEEVHSLTEFAPRIAGTLPYGNSGEILIGTRGEVRRVDPVAMEVQVARRFSRQFEMGLAIEKVSGSTARAVPYVRAGGRRLLLRTDEAEQQIRDALGRNEWGLAESVTLLASTRARWQMWRAEVDGVSSHAWFEAERPDGGMAVERNEQYGAYVTMPDGHGSVRVVSLPVASEEPEVASLSFFEVQFGSATAEDAASVATRALLNADAQDGDLIRDGVEGVWTFKSELVSITGGHAVFGSSLDPEKTLVYSSVGSANEGTELNYVRLDFATSTRITGLRSTPAGLLAFGENEAFLLRGDPALSDFQVQRVSGTLGCDAAANTTRLGGIVFTIWRGRVYSVALGMGDVDFGAGIAEISQAVYRPDDPFVEVAGEARSRELLARTESGHVYRYAPDHEAWITDVYDGIEGLTGLLPTEDVDGVRYVLNGTRLRVAEEGAEDPTVAWEHVDFGQPDRVKMLRRVRFFTDGAYDGYPKVGYATEHAEGEVLARDVGNRSFVATLPAGVMGRSVDWRITLTGAGTHTVLRPPVIVEYVPRYRER